MTTPERPYNTPTNEGTDMTIHSATTAIPAADTTWKPVHEWFAVAMNSEVVRNSRSETLKLTINDLDFIFHDLDAEYIGDDWPSRRVEDRRVPLTLDDLASEVGCSRRTMAKHLRTLEHAGLLERIGSLDSFGVYMLRFPQRGKEAQTTVADLDDRELHEQQKYLFELMSIRTARVFSRRDGLPIGTASTLSAIHLGARTVADIGPITGMTAATIRRHVGILAAHGLITFDPADEEQVKPSWGTEIHMTLFHLFTQLDDAEKGDRDDAEQAPPSAMELAAYHEAGHVVAAKLRGHEPYSVEIDAEGRGMTRTHFRGDFDIPFHVYAGPWAEVRHEWELAKKAPGYPDMDEDGLTFNDYYTMKLLVEHGHNHGDFPMLDQYRREGTINDVTEKVWDKELEWCWPMIVEDAALILAGKWEPKDEDQVEADMERLLAS